MRLGCAFATSPSTPRHVAAAESLGYERAWLYDSPALYPDVWMMLAECAATTSTIMLGPGVLVPTLRHPITNASAIAHLCHLAPGRVQVAVGAGLTGQVTVGKKALPWHFVRTYLTTLKALCAGETVEWEGSLIRLLHPAGFGHDLPCEVEWFVGAAGPKGLAVAVECADGVLAKTPMPHPGCDIVTMFGTVRDTAEPFDSARIVDAAGHLATLVLHNMVQRGTGDPAAFPGGRQWLDSYEALDPAERHLHLYEQHLVGVSDRDRPMISPELMERFAGARTVDEWHAYFDGLAAAGANEVAYQPAGSDIDGELERFAAVFHAWRDSRA